MDTPPAREDHMAIHIGRREVLCTLASAAVGPLAARAQQSAMPVVGWLSTRAPDEGAYLVAAFRQGLKAAGFVEGQNVLLEFRWGEGHYERLPAYAAELVRRAVTVIVTTGGDPAAQAAKAATTAIPIVFVSGSDPVKVGLVASLNRPGGNITGVHMLLLGLGAKRLGLLHELMPAVNLIGVLVNPNFADAQTQLRDVEGAAQSLGVKLLVQKAGTKLEIDAVFDDLARQKVGAVLVISDPFFTIQRVQIAALAARHAMPAIFELREFAAAGGLMSYGPDLANGYRQGGVYAGKILKGAKPSELPVEQPTKFELVINLKTAKMLGLTFPPGLLAIADEVIE
jgi:putative tryptophan/tyrosine transport system substrate-binding protein